MTVVYVDSVFVLNSLIDYLLFLLTARLAGLQLKRWRYTLAGFLGGIYAVGGFLPRMFFLASVPVKVMAGVLLCLIAFGGEELFLRLTMMFFGISCAFAGGILGVGLLAGHTIPRVQGVFYTNLDAKTLVISITVIYLLAHVFFRSSIEQIVQGKRVSVNLSIGGKECKLTALYDSGNSLKDLSGMPVMVIDVHAIADALPEDIYKRLEQGNHPAELIEKLRRWKPTLQPQLLCYCSVGEKEGLLLSFKSDWAVIGNRKYTALRIAISPTSLGEGFQALWGGMVERGKINEYQRAYLSTAGSPKATSGSGDSLYRR